MLGVYNGGSVFSEGSLRLVAVPRNAQNGGSGAARRGYSLLRKGCGRLAATRVAGVDLPERLVSYIQTDGWFPINATVHVTDLPRVITSLGGKELYGQNPNVCLRELIQNAADAVRARRIYEKRDGTFGSITVSVVENTGERWLEIRDDGVGMSRRVLTDFLLDFGVSFWGSPTMQEEFPGLLSLGLNATGKYGIGFFSVFMLSDFVQVITRRCDAAARDTLVLEFSAGLRVGRFSAPRTLKSNWWMGEREFD
jgi:Histidine kinase-, DNA gyrase B-, and HSP90-like ATPase